MSDLTARRAAPAPDTPPGFRARPWRFATPEERRAVSARLAARTAACRVCGGSGIESETFDRNGDLDLVSCGACAPRWEDFNLAPEAA